MNYNNGTVTGITPVTEDIFIISLHFEIPYRFIAGQYCDLSLSKEAHEHPHLFSIASDPLHSRDLEFCVRTYGDFTKALVNLPIASNVYASFPMGTLTLRSQRNPCIFFAGGMGVAPVMSMIRNLSHRQDTREITFLFGNRTVASIIYRNELEALQQKQHMKIVHVLSEDRLPPDLQGYEGFITEDIIKKEVDFASDPDYYISGPSVFVDKIETYLRDLRVQKNKIITEQPYATKFTHTGI